MADRNAVPSEPSGRRIKDASRMNSIKRAPSAGWPDSSELRPLRTFARAPRKRPYGGLGGYTPANSLGPTPAPQRPPSEFIQQGSQGSHLQDQIANIKRRRHDQSRASREKEAPRELAPAKRPRPVIVAASEISAAPVVRKKRFNVEHLRHGELVVKKVDLYLNWDEEGSSKFSMRISTARESIEVAQEEISALVVCYETQELVVRFKNDRVVELRGAKYYSPCMLLKIDRLKQVQPWFNTIKSEPGVGIAIERASAKEMEEIHREIFVRAKRQETRQPRLSLANDTLVLEDTRPLKNDVLVDPRNSKKGGKLDNDAAFASRIYTEKGSQRLQSLFSPVEKDKYYDKKHLRHAETAEAAETTQLNDEEANRKLQMELERPESRSADPITEKLHDISVNSTIQKSLTNHSLDATGSSSSSSHSPKNGAADSKSTTSNGLFAGKSPELRRSTRQITKPIEQAFEDDPERLARMRERNKKVFPSPMQYKFADNKSVEITLDDFNRLDEGEFLNDTMINFFFKLVVQSQSNLDGSVHLFNTYFYERLRTNGYAGVKNWTSKIDIFKTKYVIVPIHAKLHWYLAVIYNLPSLLEEKKTNDDLGDSDIEMTEANAVVDDISLIKHSGGKEIPVRVTRSGKESSTVNNTSPRNNLDPRNAPCIFVLDSLRAHTGSSGPQRVLKDYIVNEAREKKGIEITRDMIFGFNPYSPQQPNYCDCGVYIVHYLQRFLRLPERFAQLMIDFRSPKSKQELKHLWREDRLGNKRGKLRDWVLEMRNEPGEARRNSAVDDGSNGSDDEDILEIMAFDKDDSNVPKDSNDSKDSKEPQEPKEPK